MDANESLRCVFWGRRCFEGRSFSRLLAFCVFAGWSAIGAGSILGDDAQAGAEQKPAEKTSVAQPSTGKLVICGGGKLPDQLGRRFIEMAGGAAAKLVVITTASVLADTDRVESKLAFWRQQSVAGLTILHTRSREKANDPAFAEPLTQATGVWFIGGNQNWLTETYLGTATEREIRGVLERGGVVGGTSAGAAIMSPIMIRRDKPQLEEGPGFGFLPGTIVDQHFLKRNRQERLMRMLDSHPELVGLGIDEGTALVVEGTRMSVLGESQVVVCSPKLSDQPSQVRPLEAGAEANLTSLRSEALARVSPKDEVVARAPSDESEKRMPGNKLINATVSVNVDDQPAGDAPVDEKIGQ